MKELFLDLETSGTDSRKHSILSIGMVVSSGNIEDYQSFYREIRYDELLIVPEAISVNKFSFTEQTGRINLNHVDEEARIFVRKHFPDAKVQVIGLNVGFFDLQFVYQHMPKLAEISSYRSVDLNSIMYILAEKHSMNFKDFKMKISDKAHKTVQEMALGVEKHNALYDAVFNMCLYYLLKEDIHKIG